MATAQVQQVQQFGAVLFRVADSDGNNSSEIMPGSEDSHVCIFPDELPVDHNDLIDLLRSVLAPLKAWRLCAIEYHRQGNDLEFESILNDIIENLENHDVKKEYQNREDYSEEVTEIFVALAANAIGYIRDYRRKNSSIEFDLGGDPFVADHAKKAIDYISKADQIIRMNEYTWLVKGFYEVIVSGDMKQAETQFQTVYERASKGANTAWRKFLHAASVGMGLVAYSRGKFTEAQIYFRKAIGANPNCDPSIRLAFGCCCFKLEHFDRAMLAAKDVLFRDPTNMNALVMLALLEHVSAKKDRQKRVESRNSAFDYCMLVCAIEPKHSGALNQLANHYFHTWRLLLQEEEKSKLSFRCFAVDPEHLFVQASWAEEISVHDQIRINNCASIHSIQEIIGASFQEFSTRLPDNIDVRDFVVLKLSPPIGGNFAELLHVFHLDWKELSRVEQLSQQAQHNTSIPSITAESNLMLGKVAHSRGNLGLAFELYRRASKDQPDLSLALFGQAEILFVRQEFLQSFELFEKLIVKHPDDKDTQAYVALLKAILKQQETNFEKLREIAPGFQYEVDLWILQAQIREKNPSGHVQALKCYLNALDIIELQWGSKTAAPAALLSNIAVLHHSLNKLEKALEFSKLSLRANAETSTTEDILTELISADFEDVFYCWSEGICQLVLSVANDNESTLSFEVVTPSDTEGQDLFDLSSIVVPGSEILLNDTKYSVKAVTVRTLDCIRSPLPIFGTDSQPIVLKVKKAIGGFSDSSITYCYNFARQLEDIGHTNAAIELYFALLKRHPSFIECYLRLSLISSDKGKFDEATAWLSRALEIHDDEPDVNICLGDLYSRSGLADDAKKCYEKMSSRDKHESRAMLSLGNFYFSSSLAAKAEKLNEKSEKTSEKTGSGKGSDANVAQLLKDSYKFFHHVLHEDMTNAFAANGLGMVCVEKMEIDAAKEIFSKAREANLAHAEDISTNLAHTYMMQNRLVDAERLYEVTLKNLSMSNRGNKAAYLHQCISFAQFKHHRYRDSIPSLLRSIHLQPNHLRDWYNVAIVSELSATSTIADGDKRSKAVLVVDILQAKKELIFAKSVFHSLGRINSNQKLLNYDKKSALNHEILCQANVSVFSDHLQIAEELEARKRDEYLRREEEHRLRLQQKLDEQAKAIELLEAEKKEKQQLAAQKQRKLEELQEKWVSSVSTAAPGEGGKRKKIASKAKKSRGDDSPDILPAESTEHVDGELATSSFPSDLFGSSDEEDAVQSQNQDEDLDPTNEKRSGAELGANRPAKPSLNVDIFGADSSDEEAGKPSNADNKSKKRLRKQSSGNEEGSEDEAAELSFDATEDGDVSKNAQINSSKRSRIVTDSDDEGI